MTEAQQTQITDRPVLLYDGVCALCNRLVRSLIRRDKQAVFRFTPLEGSLGRELLARHNLHTPPDGIVLITHALTPAEHIFHRSTAVAQALQQLGNPWRLYGKVLAATPHFLREPVYKLIASHRYRIFGRYDTCPLPTQSERCRILDIDE
jgi:predicted DCC family thiol-disulfide oxidoreductase YuxK